METTFELVAFPSRRENFTSQQLAEIAEGCHVKHVEASSDMLSQASWEELLDNVVDGKVDVAICTPPGHTSSSGTEGVRYLREGQSTEN